MSWRGCQSYADDWRQLRWRSRADGHGCAGPQRRGAVSAEEVEVVSADSHRGTCARLASHGWRNTRQDVYRAGRKGFDFLGYQFSPEGLWVATKTRANFVTRARQLDEHELEGAAAASRLGVYVRRSCSGYGLGCQTAVTGLLQTHETAAPLPPAVCPQFGFLP
jgi:hypothetical protein